MSALQISGWLPFAAAAIAFAVGLVLAGAGAARRLGPERADAAVAAAGAASRSARATGCAPTSPSTVGAPRLGGRLLPGGVVADGVAAPIGGRGRAAERVGDQRPGGRGRRARHRQDRRTRRSSPSTATGCGRSTPARGAPALADSVRLPQGPGRRPRSADYQLLVAGDRLLAIGSSYGYGIALTSGDVGVGEPTRLPGRPRTVLAEVDVSDPGADPGDPRTMTLDGSYVSARLTGSTVRLVSSDYPPPVRSPPGHGRAAAAAGDRPRPGHGRAAHAARCSAATRVGDRRASPGPACSPC